MLNILVYIALIAGVNWLFDVTPMARLPGGECWPPASLAVGFVFVARDFAQRQAGHYILLAMLAGCAISWLMATPQIAFASAAAFAFGELLDWAFYTFSSKPFSQRILISSLAGAPLDSFIFLWLVGIATPVGVLLMSLSKLAGALIVSWLVRRREKAAVTANSGVA